MHLLSVTGGDPTEFIRLLIKSLCRNPRFREAIVYGSCPESQGFTCSNGPCDSVYSYGPQHRSGDCTTRRAENVKGCPVVGRLYDHRRTGKNS